MDELTFLEQFRPDGPPTVDQVLARALMADRDEVQQARAEREAEAERQAARENMALANRAAGDPLGHLTRAQWAVAEAKDRVRDLEAQLEDARQVLHRAAGEYLDWGKSAELVTTTTARRSADPDLLAEAKRITAAVTVERMLTAPRPEPRPFARGGHAVRSEVTCADCIKVGATPEQSFLIHADPDAPFERQLTDLDDAAMTTMGPAGGWRAERREGRAPMIYR